MRDYEYISPEPLYAEVREELKSYFDAGMVDDLMFDKWTGNAMARLDRNALPIKEAFIPLKNYMGDLPCDFKFVRELWVCGTLDYKVKPDPTYVYYQTDCRVSRIMDKCDPCFEIDCCNPCSDNNPKNAFKYRVTHKQMGHTIFQYNFSHLLRPGNNNAISHCGSRCPNIGHNGYDTFDIANNKVSTNFIEGNLHLTYYSDNTDEDGLLVPDVYRVQEYIRKYLTYKVFCQLSNQVTDETFNQIQMKKQESKMEADEAFVIAQTKLKEESIWDKQRAIRKINNRFNNFKRSLR